MSFLVVCERALNRAVSPLLPTPYICQPLYLSECWFPVYKYGLKLGTSKSLSLETGSGISFSLAFSPRLESLSTNPEAKALRILVVYLDFPGEINSLISNSGDARASGLPQKQGKREKSQMGSNSTNAAKDQWAANPGLVNGARLPSLRGHYQHGPAGPAHHQGWGQVFEPKEGAQPSARLSRLLAWAVFGPSRWEDGWVTGAWGSRFDLYRNYYSSM